MTKQIDPTHPHVKALTDAGIPIDRLTQLVNNATKPIAHEAVSDATAAEDQAVANMTANQQSQSQIPNYIPPLYQEQALAPEFQQMLQNIVTPPVPNNPDIPFAQIQTPGQSNG
jgi:hypothetical protein